MPVIMLSSIAQAGSGTAKRALELGAVHCFPKPLHSSREEFDATVKKLGGIVLKAASGELEPGVGSGDADGASDYQPGDKLLAVSCGQHGLDDAQHMIRAFPSNCPATVLVVEAQPEAAQNAIAAMREDAKCQIEAVTDGALLVPGSVHVAFDTAHHVIVEAAQPSRLRLVARDPVAGHRPSTDLLFGSIARAGIPAIGGLLVGAGKDGAKGLQIFSGAGYQTFVQNPADLAPRDRYEAVRALGLDADEVNADAMATWALKRTAASPD